MDSEKNCRFCAARLDTPFLDLHEMPLANSYLKSEAAMKTERSFPLRVFFCKECHLVQLADFSAAEKIFSEEYAYFSSFSTSWLKHAENYVELMVKRFGFGSSSQVIEIASNDGYLLQYFKQKKIPVLGIEPSGGCAKAAVEKGIPSVVDFFGVRLAEKLKNENKQADLLLGNNVLAHVPDLNDFVAGMKIILKPGGVITMEFPHLLRLLQEGQFDTVYHEHFSYLSFTTAEKVFAKHGLAFFDVEELSTHGGSLRIYGRHASNSAHPVTPQVARMREREAAEGLGREKTYLDFGKKVEKIRESLLKFLKDCKTRKKTVVGYGAPAKGNTLLNYCGVTTDLLQYTVDASPHKQNHYLPGSHLPIYSPEKIRQTKPDYVLILPWNLKDEISRQMACISEWGGRFVIPIPEVKVL